MLHICILSCLRMSYLTKIQPIANTGYFPSVQLRPMDCKLLAVETDHDGIIPASLRSVLSRWKPSDTDVPTDPVDGPVPKFLYTIPNGVNPTGASLTVERKREIYEVRLPSRFL